MLQLITILLHFLTIYLIRIHFTKKIISFLDNPDQDHLTSDTGVPVATHRISLQVIREPVDTCRM